MFAVRLASATQQIRVATAVVVVPLYHPLRLAEEISFADHLTGVAWKSALAAVISPTSSSALV